MNAGSRDLKNLLSIGQYPTLHRAVKLLKENEENMNSVVTVKLSYSKPYALTVESLKVSPCIA